MKKEIICGIYKITSPNGKIYIGQSRNINRRKGEHKNKHQNTIISRSIQKYDWESHVFEIICECDELELNDLELYYIKHFNTFNTEHGMNLTEGGGYAKMSEKTKEKMRATKKIKNFWTGHKHSEESKKKMSIASMGYKNNLGNIHSEESKKKMSIASKGRIVSEETRRKISNTSMGRIVSDETKKKIGEKNKGKRYPGRRLSKQTIEKISKTKKMKNYAGKYEIYNNTGKLIYKFHGNIKNKLKEYKLPRDKFCDSYRKNEIIQHNIYDGWFVLKV